VQKTYNGGCHCGAVQYQFTAEISDVMACNCSICSKRGHLLTFVPANQFSLTSGAENLTDYQFGSKTIHHLFCSTCGVNSFAKGKMPDGSEVRAINVRCVEDIDLGSIPVNEVNGREF